MKLFVREHLLLLIVQMVQCSIMIFIFFLAGFHDVKLAFYAMFLSFFLLACYLFYQYMSRRSFYKRLSNPLTTVDEVFAKESHAPIAQALQKLLISNYQLYQEEIVAIADKQEEHLIFMDRWVHQMKTPLSVIELTTSELDEPHASSIREETEQLQSGLNMVLYMARVRSVMEDFHIKKVDLTEVVQTITTENKRLFIRKRVYPRVQIRDEGMTVESDEKWLGFILTQFIHNAVKYTANQSDVIDIILYKREEVPVFEIMDYGIGIPQEDMNRIFKAFFTGENGRKFKESTGVGLYITEEIANYMGHQIEVESTVGKGSAFRLVFE